MTHPPSQSERHGGSVSGSVLSGSAEEQALRAAPADSRGSVAPASSTSRHAIAATDPADCATATSHTMGYLYDSFSAVPYEPRVPAPANQNQPEVAPHPEDTQHGQTVARLLVLYSRLDPAPPSVAA